MTETVLITGAAGYVGSSLVPHVLDEGYRVKGLDLMLFGDHGLMKERDRCEIISGDLRNNSLVERCLEGVDHVIHLAAISNDPMGNMNPLLTEQVNLTATETLVKLARKQGVKRFIYASSSSVYGIKNDPEVTEDLPLAPLTVYSRTKAESEKGVLAEASSEFIPVCIRPATICGYSPRLRLDVIVNIFAHQAITARQIKVNGGSQTRPNVHMDDMVDLYSQLLVAPANVIRGQVYNFGGYNHSALELANITKQVVGDDVIITQLPPTADSRSYSISSKKILKALGISPKKSISDAVTDLKTAFEDGRVPNPQDSHYYNIKRMRELDLK